MQRKQSDAELIVAFKEGNAEAFGTLFKRHSSTILTAIYLIVRNKEIAEDILQDTFIKAITKITDGKYKEQNSSKSWLMRIAHNLCIDHLRKQKRLGITMDLKEELYTPVSELNKEEQITKDEDINHVRKILDCLQKEQREVILLRHYAGLQFKEIAALINIPLNTALGRMRYGLINLRKLQESFE